MAIRLAQQRLMVEKSRAANVADSLYQGRDLSGRTVANLPITTRMLVAERVARTPTAFVLVPRETLQTITRMARPGPK